MYLQLSRSSGKIVAFPLALARRNWLTERDIKMAADWRPRLALHGFDRFEHHRETVCNDPDLRDFLSLYREGDRWATWCFSREGCHVVAWRSTTGRDGGRVINISMDATIRAVLRLGGAAIEEPAEDEGRPPINVIPFPRLEAAMALGS